MARIPRFGRSGDVTSEHPTADPELAPDPDGSPTSVMALPDASTRVAARPDVEIVDEGATAVPAGAEPEADGSLSFAERARARRRLRFLRRARELGFRDVGGLVFDLHRYGRQRDDLIAAKVHTLAVMDQELRALETLLRDRRSVTVLHEPGIIACPRCAAIHGTDGRFCANCGLPIGARADMPMAVPTPATASTAAAQAAAPYRPPSTPQPLSGAVSAVTPQAVAPAERDLPWRLPDAEPNASVTPSDDRPLSR